MKICLNVNLAQLAGGSKGEFRRCMEDSVRRRLTIAFNAALDHEMDEFLGVGWHERGAITRRGYRCGYRKRSFVFLDRQLELRVPRVRTSGFRGKFKGGSPNPFCTFCLTLSLILTSSASGVQ